MSEEMQEIQAAVAALIRVCQRHRARRRAVGHLRKTAMIKDAYRLTPTMKECLEYMSSNGRALYRHAGGAWSVKHPGSDARYFRLGTVRGLVERGYADVFEYAKNRAGRFPVAVKMV